MEDWKSYHDLLPDANLKMYHKQVCGMILKLQLHDRARELARRIPSDKIQSEGGAFHIVNALYERDFLAVLSTVYSDFKQSSQLSTWHIQVVQKLRDEVCFTFVKILRTWQQLAAVKTNQGLQAYTRCLYLQKSPCAYFG